MPDSRGVSRDIIMIVENEVKRNSLKSFLQFDPQGIILGRSVWLFDKEAPWQGVAPSWNHHIAPYGSRGT